MIHSPRLTGFQICIGMRLIPARRLREMRGVGSQLASSAYRPFRSGMRQDHLPDRRDGHRPVRPFENGNPRSVSSFLIWRLRAG